jgi:hypothetical protein
MPCDTPAIVNLLERATALLPSAAVAERSSPANPRRNGMRFLRFGRPHDVRTGFLGKIAERFHTRGLVGTSRSSTPGFDLRAVAKRSPARAPR